MRVLRKSIPCVIFACCLVSAATARSQAFEIASKAGEKISAWAGLTPADMAAITVLLENVRQMLENSNNALAMARQTHRAVEYVKDYSLEALQRDGEAALSYAFPELNEVRFEGQLAQHNADGIHDSTFFRLVDYHDYRVRNRAMQAMRSAMLPDAKSTRRQKDEDDVTAVDLLVQKRFDALNMSKRRGRRAKGYEKLSGHSDDVYRKSQGNTDMTVEAAAITAKTTTQISRDIAESLDLEQQSVAEEELKRNASLGVTGALLAVFEDKIDFLWPVSE